MQRQRNLEECFHSMYFRLYCPALRVGGELSNRVAQALVHALHEELHSRFGRLMCYTVFIILRPYISEERRCFVEADREDVVVYFKRLEPVSLDYYGLVGSELSKKYSEALKQRGLVLTSGSGSSTSGVVWVQEITRIVCDEETKACNESVCARKFSHESEELWQWKVDHHFP
jgi:hypothetical protein